LEPGPEQLITWESGGFPEVVAEDESVHAGPPAPHGIARLANRSRRALTLIVEERAWVKDALTADRITALQAFRDLFASVPSLTDDSQIGANLRVCADEKDRADFD
ncbi:MAG: hypothetical protein L0219_06360, partial [Phycisphaerales bacterium]|nr:hypothetical protein [Phycisphaerales bacterium]